MDRRFSLAAALAILIAGAAFIWLRPEQAADGVYPPGGPSAVPSSGEPAPAAPEPRHPNRRAPYVLAVAWFKGFCEEHPAYPECLSATHDEYFSLTLHGLWPGGAYCGVSETLKQIDASGRWDRLPAVELSDSTWQALREVMPGSRSELERHEWLAHGTCSGVSQETYFRRAAALARDVDRAVRDVFVRFWGDILDNSDVRSAFDAAFGKGAGKRVRLNCELLDGHLSVTELTINLYGDVFGDVPLGRLILDARTRSPGCDRGQP